MNIENLSVNLLLSDNKNDLYIEVDNNNSNINFKYELYGNKNFYSSGITKCKNSFIPTLKFRILDDNIFFLKIKIFNKTNSSSLFKFFNIDEYKPDENLSMSIEDLNRKNLLDSINLSNDNHDYNSSSESDNDLNIVTLSDNENNSDSEIDNQN
tara:strand:- start:1394 stop:1855 length:462 start_codon:yes stop_codon:yes gene_type:complete